jgi:hypothetical protein
MTKAKENVKELVEKGAEVMSTAEVKEEATQVEYLQVPKDIYVALYNYFIMTNKDVLSLYEATKHSVK